MGSLALGLLCALCAAACYGAGPLLQALGARSTAAGSGLGLGLLGRLVRNKFWLAGVGTDFGGFGFEALALALAPAAFVTPLLLFDMVVLALLASRVVKERITRLGVLGMAVLIGGGILLTAAFATSHHQIGRQASFDAQLALAGMVAFAAVVALLAGRARRPSTATAIMAAAAGISYAAATLCTRQLSVSLRHHSVLHELVSPAPYVLTAASLLSLSLLSRALQSGAAVVAVPVTSALAALLPAAAGLAFFGEPVPSGAALAAFLLALPLLVGGLVMLARQSTVSDMLASEAAGTSHSLPRPRVAHAVPADAEGVMEGSGLSPGPAV